MAKRMQQRMSKIAISKKTNRKNLDNRRKNIIALLKHLSYTDINFKRSIDPFSAVERKRQVDAKGAHEREKAKTQSRRFKPLPIHFWVFRRINTAQIKKWN